ncbi:hypothetical protein O181_054459 [Austropuccinia psidii MF-1]|uniref:Uncharacterized protein n=1 Tax=Austropuccinia psidii MF-1 TaxID=1389203 RepID=A0A9Q3E4P4_9BASI|nr:hypothetical protein [Austropuccinia psidii MF-1]
MFTAAFRRHFLQVFFLVFLLGDCIIHSVFLQSISSWNLSSTFSTEETSENYSTSTTNFNRDFISANLKQVSSKGTWCGRPAHSQSSPPGVNGAFFDPPTVERPLLNLKCSPRVKPYLEADSPSIGSIIVDAALTYYQLEGAIELPQSVEQLQIIVINTKTNKAFAGGIVGVNTLSNELPFSLNDLGNPNMDSLSVVCQAYANEEWLTETPFSLDYLPTPSPNELGSVVRVTANTGILLVIDQNERIKPLLPFGFAIDFKKILQPSQLSEWIKHVQDLNINTIQVIPTAQNITELSHIDSMLKMLSSAQLWIQYDFRNFYWNKTLVAAHIRLVKKYPNLLLYHTAMEPDGHYYEINGLSQTNIYIRKNDAYRPLSLTLNCEDYYFANYTQGMDVILTNPFVIGMSSNNGSSDRPPRSDSVYGSCLCDNCRGSFLDLIHRLRLFRKKRHFLGKTRAMQFWGVPQASSVDQKFERTPSGQEFLLMCTMYLIEGAVGLMTWNDDLNLSSDLQEAMQTMGSVLPTIASYLLEAQAFLPLPTTESYPNDTFIANIWVNKNLESFLLMTANLDPKEVSWNLTPPLPVDFPQEQLRTSYLYTSRGATNLEISQGENGVSFKGGLEGYGFGVWIVSFGKWMDSAIQLSKTNSKKD